MNEITGRKVYTFSNRKIEQSQKSEENRDCPNQTIIDIFSAPMCKINNLIACYELNNIKETAFKVWQFIIAK